MKSAISELNKTSNPSLESSLTQEEQKPTYNKTSTPEIQNLRTNTAPQENKDSEKPKLGAGHDANTLNSQGTTSLKTPQKKQNRVLEHSNRTQSEKKKAHNQKKSEITIRLSASSIAKLKSTAGNEGISVEDLVKELISEGMVLRAWSTFDKKNSKASQPQNRNQPRNQNRSSASGNGNQKFGNSIRGHQSSGGNGNLKGRGAVGSENRRRNNSYSNIMDDSTSFLEYVRNQEKQQR